MEIYNPFGQQRYSPYFEFNKGWKGGQMWGQIFFQLTSQNFLLGI